MTTNAMTFGLNLLMMIECQTFSQLMMSKNWHGLAPMGHQEPASLFSITHQTHTIDIQGSGGS
jgi:hypothetical protein